MADLNGVRGGQGRSGREVAWLGWLMLVVGALFIGAVVWCAIVEARKL